MHHALPFGRHRVFTTWVFLAEVRSVSCHGLEDVADGLMVFTLLHHRLDVVISSSTRSPPFHLAPKTPPTESICRRRKLTVKRRVSCRVLLVFAVAHACHLHQLARRPLQASEARRRDLLLTIVRRRLFSLIILLNTDRRNVPASAVYMKSKLAEFKEKYPDMAHKDR